MCALFAASNTCETQDTKHKTNEKIAVFKIDASILDAEILKKFRRVQKRPGVFVLQFYRNKIADARI